MPAYCLFDNLEVHDPEKLETYKREVAPVVQRFGGRYLVLGGQVDRVEGDWAPRFLVMIEFPSLEQAQRWYRSDDYARLKQLRLEAGRYDGVIVEGLPA